MQERDRDDEDETNVDDTDEEDEANEDVLEQEDCEKGIKEAVKKSLKEFKMRQYDEALREAEKKSLQDFHDQVYSNAQRDILRLPRPGTVPPVSKPDKSDCQSSDVSKTKTKDKY